MSKIVFHLNSMEKGGAERVVNILSGRFAANGYEVLIATEWQGTDEYPLAEGVKRVHVGLEAGEDSGHGLLHGRLRNFFRRLSHLRRFLEKEQPDLVIAFAKKAIYRALLATGKTGIPVILSVRTSPVGNYDGKLDKLLIPLLYPKAAGAVFQTTEARDFFPKTLADRSVVILNPVRKECQGHREPAYRKKEIVQVGRLDQFKDQLILLQAMYRVHQVYPDYVLKIYGGDSGDGTKEKLQQSILEHQARDYVFLMGSVDHPEEYIGQAALFVLSSYAEGMPNALMEAMALGLPVVATDCPCGGPAELIRDGENGKLVPVKDVEAMAETMLFMLQHKEEAEAMGREARKLGDRADEARVFEAWRDYTDTIIKAE